MSATIEQPGISMFYVRGGNSYSCSMLQEAHKRSNPCPWSNHYHRATRVRRKMEMLVGSCKHRHLQHQVINEKHANKSIILHVAVYSNCFV